MIYINKDVDETLDYVIVTSEIDPIQTITYNQSAGYSVNVMSCSTNVTPILDDQGNEYPAKSTIILWVSGGTPDTVETLRVSYSTEAGRRLDEMITFRLVQED